jgi:hypothetical protein
VEVKGRWCLVGCQFDLNLLGILSQAPATAPDNDSPYTRLGDKLVDSLVHSRSEAVETLKTNYVLRDSASLDSLRRGAEQAMALVLIDGGVVKCSAVETQSVGGVLALRTYFVQCSRGAIQIDLLFYRPGDDWTIFGFLFKPVTSIADMFASAPLELSSPSAAPHTALAPKAERSEAAKPQPR